jgi:hypothetical protein
MFSDSVALIASFDLGDIKECHLFFILNIGLFDAPYVDSTGNIKGLLYHKLLRSLKEMLRLKSFANASVILIIFKVFLNMCIL